MSVCFESPCHVYVVILGRMWERFFYQSGRHILLKLRDHVGFELAIFSKSDMIRWVILWQAQPGPFKL